MQVGLVRFSQNVRLVVSRHMQLPHRLEMIPGIVDISAMRSACSAIKICAVQHPNCGRLGRLIETAGDRTRSVATAHTVLNWTPRCGSRPYTVVLGTAGHESIRYSVVLGVGHIKIPRCSVLARAEYQHHSTRCVPQKLTVSA